MMGFIYGLFVLLLIAIIAFVDWSIGFFTVVGTIMYFVCMGVGIAVVIVAFLSVRKDLGFLKIVIYPFQVFISVIYMRVLYYFASSLREYPEGTDFLMLNFEGFLYILNLFYCIAMAFIVTGVFFQISALYMED